MKIVLHPPWRCIPNKKNMGTWLLRKMTKHLKHMTSSWVGLLVQIWGGSYLRSHAGCRFSRHEQRGENYHIRSAGCANSFLFAAVCIQFCIIIILPVSLPSVSCHKWGYFIVYEVKKEKKKKKPLLKVGLPHSYLLGAWNFWPLMDDATWFVAYLVFVVEVSIIC